MKIKSLSYIYFYLVKITRGNFDRAKKSAMKIIKVLSSNDVRAYKIKQNQNQMQCKTYLVSRKCFLGDKVGLNVSLKS